MRGRATRTGTRGPAAPVLACPVRCRGPRRRRDLVAALAPERRRRGPGRDAHRPGWTLLLHAASGGGGEPQRAARARRRAAGRGLAARVPEPGAVGERPRAVAR